MHARLTLIKKKDELDAKNWETNAFARGRVNLIPVRPLGSEKQPIALGSGGKE